jgi:hypothetical protein
MQIVSSHAIPITNIRKEHFTKMEIVKVDSPMISSSSSDSYDLFSNGITINNFPTCSANVEELADTFCTRKVEAFDEIQKLHSTGKLLGGRLKKIMLITDYLYKNSPCRDLQNESLKILLKQLSIENVYVCLSHAIEINAHAQIEQCFKFIEKEICIKIISESDKLLIQIRSLSIPLIIMITSLNNLEKIYPNRILAVLNPNPDCIVNQDIFERFIKSAGVLLQGLNLNNHNIEVSDEFLKKIIQYCPNLKYLTIKSNILQGYGLEKIHELQKLVFLDLSWCTNLFETKGINKSNLLTINFSNCNLLYAIVELPSKLDELDVSYCPKLKYLPWVLPPNLKINVSECWNLRKFPSLLTTSHFD